MAELMVDLRHSSAAVVNVLGQHRRQFLTNVLAVAAGWREKVLGVFGAERGPHIDLRQIKASCTAQLRVNGGAVVLLREDLGVSLNGHTHRVAQALRLRAAGQQNRGQRHAGAQHPPPLRCSPQNHSPNRLSFRPAAIGSERRWSINKVVKILDRCVKSNYK